LPDYLKPIVTFAYYTGWRRGEILSLKWNQVDLKEKLIRLYPGSTKSGDGRSIALDGELLETIQRQWGARKVVTIPDQAPSLCPFVFHHSGKAIKDFRAAWEGALRKTGLSGKIFHDFRRTGVRNMIRAGISEQVAMKISGHKTRSVFDRYDIVNEQDLKEAAKKTTEHMKSQNDKPVIRPLDQGRRV